MIKPHEMDGFIFNKEFIESLKHSTIELRDEALKQNDMNYSLSLSLIYAALNHYQEHLES